MRAWRSATGFLADLGPTSQAVTSSLALELPDGPWRDFHEFVSLAPDGAVRERYRVQVWSLDDDLGVSTHAVIDGELRNLTVVVSYHGRVRRDEKKIESDLQELTDLTVVREALALDDRTEKAARERREAEGKARVAAIPGAVEDFGLGESFRRAQVLLVDRVRRDGNALCADLLRALAMFGRLRREFGDDPAFAAALEAYVAACRLATFDKVTPPATIVMAGVDGRMLRELKPLLARLQQQLLDAAAGQEESDARLNAIEYRKASIQVGRALSLFRPPPL
jgi:hypothetical protein